METINKLKKKKEVHIQQYGRDWDDAKFDDEEKERRYR